MSKPKPTTLISDVPMLTHDECEIKLNGIVYGYSYDNGYSFEGTCKPEIVVYRVISVNQSARHFRVRCAKGCETEFSYAKGRTNEGRKESHPRFFWAPAVIMKKWWGYLSLHARANAAIHVVCNCVYTVSHVPERLVAGKARRLRHNKGPAMSRE